MMKIRNYLVIRKLRSAKQKEFTTLSRRFKRERTKKTIEVQFFAMF